MNEAQLIKTIKAHIAKGEQHYISAGLHLAKLKERCPDQATFLALVKDKIGIGKSRTYELLQIADGRKTVEEVRADTADRQEKHRLSVTNGQGHDLAVIERDDEPEEDPDDPEVAASLQKVERMSEESREDLFNELQDRYRNNFGHPLYEWQNDLDIVRTIVEAIGADRARALGKKISGLVLKAVGRAALPDCGWCGGDGLRTAEYNGRSFKAPCDCTRRKRSEKDFAALKARIDRENAEQQIPQQDFSYGLEVTTKDGKVWASGVRLPTEEEAKFYIDYWARHELRKHGYVTWENDPSYGLIAFDIKRHDEPPMMKITGGKAKTMNFMHGTCGLLGPKGWRPISGGECECKKCKKAEKAREADERLLKQYEIAERALQAGEISQEQFDEWENSTDATLRLK